MKHAGLALGCLAAVGSLACSKVPNPFYHDEIAEESGTASETGTSDSGEESTSSSTDESASESESTDASDTTDAATDTLDDSEADTDCPPEESGCPCVQGTMCFPGVTVCIDGICLAPEDCTLEDPNVHVDYQLGAMQAADTNCSVTPMVQGSALTLSIGGCDDGQTSLTVGLDPLPPGFPGLGDSSVGVRVHFEQDGTFIRLALPSVNLWLVEGSLLVSGNGSVSDYPGEVVAAIGECPATPKFCGQDVGEVQRRGVRVLGLPFYDGSSGLVDASMAAWVDVAVVDCMVPAYRFALVDWQ